MNWTYGENELIEKLVYHRSIGFTVRFFSAIMWRKTCSFIWNCKETAKFKLWKLRCPKPDSGSDDDIPF